MPSAAAAAMPVSSRLSVGGMQHVLPISRQTSSGSVSAAAASTAVVTAPSSAAATSCPPMPPPPPKKYFSLYTKEHVRAGRAPSPPPPPSDSYKMFGMPFQVNDPIIRPLESQNIKRLYPQNADHKKELKKFNHSIVVNFLDVLDILTKSPGMKEREEKITDLNLLFIQMHHLINEFRPSEARETLRVMLEFQKSSRIETAERFQRHLDKVVELLQHCQSSLKDGADKKETNLKPLNPDHSSDRDRYLAENSECSTADVLMCEQVDVFCQQLAESELVTTKS